MSSRSHRSRAKIVSRPKENGLNKSLPAILMISASLLRFTPLLAHPHRAVKRQASNKPLPAGAPVYPAVRQIVERSCQICRSEKTNWPGYSHVARVSWLIEKDVNQGRSHVNLFQYAMLRPEARLPDSDIDRIDRWVRAERVRLESIADSR